MSELLASMIPSSFSYTLPLVPLFLFFWLMQYRCQRRLLRESGVETRTEAGQVAREMLALRGLSEIAVEKSDNYSQNEYVESERKILLSPDTFDQKDLTAIGLAARAVGKAVCSRLRPNEFKRLGKIKSVLLVLFWIVFTVMAFGLMGNSLPTIWVGYGLIFVMLALVTIEFRMEFGVNREVKKLLAETGVLDEREQSAVDRVLRADALKF